MAACTVSQRPSQGWSQEKQNKLIYPTRRQEGTARLNAGLVEGRKSDRHLPKIHLSYGSPSSQALQLLAPLSFQVSFQLVQVIHRLRADHAHGKAGSESRCPGETYLSCPWVLHTCQHSPPGETQACQGNQHGARTTGE